MKSIRSVYSGFHRRQIMRVLTHASIVMVVIVSSLNSLERLRRDEFYGLNNFQQRLGSHRREKVAECNILQE